MGLETHELSETTWILTSCKLQTLKNQNIWLLEVVWAYFTKPENENTKFTNRDWCNFWSSLVITCCFQPLENNRRNFTPKHPGRKRQRVEDLASSKTVEKLTDLVGRGKNERIRCHWVGAKHSEWSWITSSSYQGILIFGHKWSSSTKCRKRSS